MSHAAKVDLPWGRPWPLGGMDRALNADPHGHRFDPRGELLDPYTKALTGGDAWGIAPSGRRWCCVVDSMQAPPHDSAEPGAEEALAGQGRYVVGPRSVVVLVAR